MVDLPQKKVGIVACSGEELPEGTVTRLAALRVLEQLRPSDTVTICLPLFLAGGEGDRAFARFYPTIALDGCHLRCAARATEMYSGKPAASIVVAEIINENQMEAPAGTRRLNDTGKKLVDLTAQRIAETVDDLLGKRWSRKTGEFIEIGSINQRVEVSEPQSEAQATCSCGSGIPIQKMFISGNMVTMVGLPLIFQQYREAGKPPTDSIKKELYNTTRIYNPIPAGEEDAYAEALLREYTAFWEKELAK